jgi:1,4-alpha-glucan branching enzyme
VWAPFASSVFAAGTFNKWSDTGNPFASEGNGYWSVDVPGAKIGDEYQFVIRNGNQPPLSRGCYWPEMMGAPGVTV